MATTFLVVYTLMAESTNTATPADVPEAPVGARDRRRQAIVGLAIAAVILALAWVVADRAGVGDLGQAGINSNILPKVGEEAPDFVAVSPEGEIVHLSDFRGQPVWLNFWGAWCPPCRAEMPDIQAAYEQLEGRGLRLLAVSLGDKPSEAIGFAELNGVTFDILLDPDRTLTGESYPIYNFPTHIFIDEDGIVRNIVLAQMSTAQAIDAAESILSDQPSDQAR